MAWVGLPMVVMLLVCSVAFAELPKISCQSGATYGSFYFADTGKPFYPEGNVFQRLDLGSQCQFNVGIYDDEETEDVLSEMEALGYNMVRVWIDCTSRESNYGAAGPYSRNVVELYPDYMDNFIDFLERCTDHNIYVIAVSTFFPINTYYCNIYYSGQADHVTGWNTYFYSPGGWDAKCAFWEEFASEIADADSGELINTILAFEVANEICSRTDCEPFSLTSGNVTTPTGTYDMSSAASRQQCHDAGLGQFIMACADSIRDVIPDAVCGASVFTNLAVGHSGFNGLLPRDAPDPRWPARIYWFPPVEDISYVDIHLYPSGGSYSLADDLASMEWSSIDKDEKPFFASEIGAYESYYSTISSARTALVNLRDSIYSTYGFSGQCLYTWDAEGDDNYWSATESSYYIASKLDPLSRWRIYNFTSDLQSWTTHDMNNVSVSGGIVYGDFDTSSTDAYMLSPSGLTIDTKYVRKVTVRLKNDSNANGIDLYWITNNDTTWGTNDKVIHLAQTAYSGSYIVYEFDLWDEEKCEGQAEESWIDTVTQFRVEVGRLWGGGRLSGHTHVDYIYAYEY